MKNIKKKAVLSGLIIAAIMSGISGSSAVNTPVVPVAKNPIVNTSNVAGISITSAMVQDNVDPKTKKAITDRLLIAVVNKGSKSATGFEIFYAMTDSVTKATENYYLPLTGFTLKPGATGYLNFDGKTGAGHFPENKFSLYRSSTNEVKFNIQLSAKGYKIAASTAVKDKGTGEKVD
jgi:hypothetical protein